MLREEDCVKIGILSKCSDCDVAGAFDEAYVPQEPRSLRG